MTTLAEELQKATQGPVVSDATRLSIIRISGNDAENFLQGQLTNDLRKLSALTVQASAYCSPRGRVLADLTLWREDGPVFYAVIRSELCAPVVKRLRMFILRSQVQIEDCAESLHLMALGGPGSDRTVKAVFGQVPAPYQRVVIDGRTAIGLPGDRYLVTEASGVNEALWKELLTQATGVDFTVWEWLTIRSGVGWVTAATQDQFVPQTANLDVLGAISFQKGCYTGQEIVARTQYLGRLKERLFLAHTITGPPQPGTKVYSPVFGEQACGMVMNAAPSPDGGADLLMVVQLGAIDGVVTLERPEGPPLTLLPLPYEIPVNSTTRPKLS